MQTRLTFLTLNLNVQVPSLHCLLTKRVERIFRKHRVALYLRCNAFAVSTERESAGLKADTQKIHLIKSVDRRKLITHDENPK